MSERNQRGYLIPATGWAWVTCTDLGSDERNRVLCEHCLVQRVRYLHTVAIDDRTAKVGYVCADRLTGDGAAAHDFEQKLRSETRKRAADAKREAEREAAKLRIQLANERWATEHAEREAERAKVEEILRAERAKAEARSARRAPPRGFDLAAALRRSLAASKRTPPTPKALLEALDAFGACVGPGGVEVSIAERRSKSGFFAVIGNEWHGAFADKKSAAYAAVAELTGVKISPPTWHPNAFAEWLNNDGAPGPAKVSPPLDCVSTTEPTLFLRGGSTFFRRRGGAATYF